jgi:phage terminase large subunit-like protein
MRRKHDAHKAIDKYVKDVLGGRIVACQATIAAVNRYVSDLERQNSDDFPYYFSLDVATACCDFFPSLLRHSIGKNAGKPFGLEPWQMFGIWNIFGWKRCADRTRRFRRFFWTMARKNGKSTLGAGIAILGAMADINPFNNRPEDVAEVVLCATKKEQVEKVMYAEIERMRLQSEHVKAMSTPINRQITFTHNKGYIRCIGSDKPFDGLNPHMVLMDEKHAWREHHRKFYDTMVTGSGNRSQPIIGDFTTAGDDTSLLWQEDINYARGVVMGDFVDETYFSYIFELDEQDNPLDESLWPKANPNLGVSIELEYLREQAAKASTSAVDLNRFTRYHGNRKVSSFSRFILPADWDELASDLSTWRDADAITAGIDLGGRDDLASFGVVARFPVDEDEDGNTIWRYEGFTRSFIVDETHRDLSKQPWAGWIASGELVVSRYVVAALRDEFLAMADEQGIRAVAYDPYNAAQLGDELSQAGLEVLKMPQNHFQFHEPMQELTAAIREKRFTPDKTDNILRWCALNMMTTTNAQGKMMPDKRNSSEKIDAAVALLMALRLAMLAPSRPTGSLFIV